MDKVNVVCVYRPGNGLTDEYVHRLYQGVAKHMHAPFEFVCMSTKDVAGIKCIPLRRRNANWWNKLEIFREGLFSGLTVYLDLDSMIIADVTDMFTHPHEFTAGANWGLTHKAVKGRAMNSGLMMWNADLDLSHLDIKVNDNLDDEYSVSPFKWGDQAYIQDHLGFDFTDVESLFPNRYVSYKMHVRRQGQVPPDASIVAFHGRPRPHEVNWRLPDGRSLTPRQRNCAIR